MLPWRRMHGIHWFHDAEAPVSLVGGKGASLCVLTKAGFAVPPGFIITDPASPDILAAFALLKTSHVAVRSSATVEDGAQAAWAGQFVTLLNIAETSLLRCVKECFDSATSARAVAYAAQHSVTPEAIRMAVIVQTMVDGDFSGVAFSAHPVTQDRNTIVIEVIRGQGEALVSGHVTPDTIVIEKSSGEIIEQHLADATPLLNTAQHGLIVDAVRNIASLYGYPVDVEWTMKDGTLFILQARPITTLV